MGFVLIAGRALFNVSSAAVKISGAAGCGFVAGSLLARAHNHSLDQRANPNQLPTAIANLAFATLFMGVSTALSASARRSLTHKRQWRVTGGITFLLQATYSVGAFMTGYRNDSSRGILQLINALEHQPRKLLNDISGYSIFQQTIARGAAPTLLSALSSARMELLTTVSQPPHAKHVWSNPYIKSYAGQLTWNYGGPQPFADRLSSLETDLKKVPHFDQKQQTLNWLNESLFELRNGSTPQQDLIGRLKRLEQAIRDVAHPFDHAYTLLHRQISALVNQLPQGITQPHPIDEITVDYKWDLPLLTPDANTQRYATDIQTNLDHIIGRQGLSCAAGNKDQVAAIKVAITATHQQDSANFLEALTNQLPAITALEPTRRFGQDAQRVLIAQIEALIGANRDLDATWYETYVNVATDGTITFSTDDAHGGFDQLFYSILTDLKSLNNAIDNVPFTKLIADLTSMQNAQEYLKQDQDTLSQLPATLKAVHAAVASEVDTDLSRELLAQLTAVIEANFPHQQPADDDGTNNNVPVAVDAQPVQPAPDFLGDEWHKTYFQRAEDGAISFSSDDASDAFDPLFDQIIESLQTLGKTQLVANLGLLENPTGNDDPEILSQLSVLLTQVSHEAAEIDTPEAQLLTQQVNSLIAANFE